MPIYEYTCNKCSNIFEEIVFSNDEIPSCPSCKGSDCEKLISRSRHSSSSSFNLPSHMPSSSSASSCSGCSSKNCSSCK